MPDDSPAIDDGPDADVREIRDLIDREFGSLYWTPEEDPEWGRFTDCFHRDARMFPARRPAVAQTPNGFRERMDALRDAGVLHSLSGRAHHLTVRVVGTVAIAMAGCELLENGTTTSRDVSGFLLVKDPQGWRIVGQAWDLVHAFPEPTGAD